MSRDSARETLQKCLDFYRLACKEEDVNKAIAFQHFFELSVELQRLRPDKRKENIRGDITRHSSRNFPLYSYSPGFSLEELAWMTDLLKKCIEKAELLKPHVDTR